MSLALHSFVDQFSISKFRHLTKTQHMGISLMLAIKPVLIHTNFALGSSNQTTSQFDRSIL